MVLGELDALAAQPTGLPAGEEELDRGGALRGHLFGEFMGVGTGFEEQRNLFLGDLGPPYGEAVTAVPVVRLRSGDGCRHHARDQQ